MLWWVLALGFAFGFLPRARPSRRVLLPLGALAGLVAWTALSLLWTESDERTFTELARLVDYAGLVVLAWSVLNSSTWKAAAAGLSVAALAIPALSLASRLDPGAFPPDEIARAFSGDRLSYPLDYWNGVAAWAAMAVALGLAWSAHLRRPALRALSLAAVPVAGVTIYLTYSRAGVVGFALAMFAVLALSRNRWTVALHGLAATVATGAVILVIHGQDAIEHGTGGDGGGVVALALLLAASGCAAVALATRRWGIDRFQTPAPVRLVVAATLALALLATALVGPRLASRASAQFTATPDSSAANEPSARVVSLEGSRYRVWSSGLGAFGSDPLKGIGPGTFEFWWERDVKNGEPLRDAHSLYLETLAELGMPGALLLVAFLAGLLMAASAARRRLDGSVEIGAMVGLTAAFIVFLLHAGVDWMWELSAVPVLGLGAIAIAGSAGSQPRPRRGRLSAGRIAIVVLAIAAGAVQVPGLVSTVRVRDSARSLDAGFEPQAIELADDAVAAEPWAATPYAERAWVELSAGHLVTARADAARAIAREPTNWRHRLLMFRIEDQAGDTRAAIRALKRVKSLNPAVGPQVTKLRHKLTATPKES